MKKLGFAFVFTAIGLSPGLVVGCGGDDFDSCEADATCPSKDGGTGGANTGGAGGTNTGGTGGAGGTSGAGGAGGVAGGDGGTCDTTKSPSEAACLVDDQYAVFVNGTAATSGSGTRSSPFKTIGEALSAASGKLILVCVTTYDEQVKVTGAASLHGGFSCNDWSYEAGKRAVIKPSAKGFALEIDSVTTKVLVDDLDFAAANASAPGESSIAAVVRGSADVQMRRVKLAGGKGMAGANGTLAPHGFPTQASLKGNDASGTAGGTEKKCTCPGGALTTGGIGGTASTGGQAGGKGTPDTGGGTAGDPAKACNSGGGGGKGNPGKSLTEAAGAATFGLLTASGWSPTGGAKGSDGGPGQGGGGGASTASGGGGGGGCGGCGGAGAPGGGGGGASIALLVLGSTVGIAAGSELSTADAGAGGTGAGGQSGQIEFGFAGAFSADGCAGGAGGPGGTGAAGGGGAGGISVAVAWKGPAPPTVDSGTKFTIGKKGVKGAGGKAGVNDGIDGIEQETLEVQ